MSENLPPLGPPEILANLGLVRGVLGLLDRQLRWGRQVRIATLLERWRKARELTPLIVTLAPLMTSAFLEASAGTREAASSAREKTEGRPDGAARRGERLLLEDAADIIAAGAPLVARLLDAVPAETATNEVNVKAVTALIERASDWDRAMSAARARWKAEIGATN